MSIFYEQELITESGIKEFNNKILNSLSSPETRIKNKDKLIASIKSNNKQLEVKLTQLKKLPKEDREYEKKQQEILLITMITTMNIMSAAAGGPLMMGAAAVGSLIGAPIGIKLGNEFNASTYAKELGKDKKWVKENMSEANIEYIISCNKKAIEKLEKQKSEIKVANEFTSIFY